MFKCIERIHVSLLGQVSAPQPGLRGLPRSGSIYTLNATPAHQPATPKPDRYQITPPPLCLCLWGSISKAPPFWLPPVPTRLKAKPELHLLHGIRSLTQPLTPTKGSISASFCYFNIINPLTSTLLDDTLTLWGIFSLQRGWNFLEDQKYFGLPM